MQVIFYTMHLSLTGEHIVPSVFRDIASETCIVGNEELQESI